VSAKPPKDGGAWLKTDVGVETILLRYTDETWDNRPNNDWIMIENLCRNCPDFPAPLTPENMAQLLNRTSQSLHDRTASWTGISNRIWTLIPANKISKPRITPNGLTNQYSAFGKFDLGADEALLLTIPKSNADYQGIQLGNRWFHSLDFKHRQSSLTRNQSQIGPDGLITFVVSRQDPGIWNWLDTNELEQGLIMIRWQGTEIPPSSEMTTQKVKFSTLDAILPPETRYVSAQERKQHA